MSSRAITFYVITCDCCGFEEEEFYEYSVGRNLEDTHAIAVEYGWVIADDMDLCPKCLRSSEERCRNKDDESRRAFYTIKG